MGALRDFFTPQELKLIEETIGAAEKITSGELRVRVVRRAGDDPAAAAHADFDKLGMTHTKRRNGVLFFMAVEDQAFVVVGDEGLARKVPEDFWDVVRDLVLRRFHEGNFAEGLEEGLKCAGEQLAAWFPCPPDDVNELPDAVSFADEDENNIADGRQNEAGKNK